MATQTTAVAAAPKAGPPAVNKNSLGDLQRLLESHKDQIAMALPRHMTPERMIRVAMTAVSTTPALHECSATSIAACIVQSSILGLEPNSVLGESYLIPFNRNAAPKGQPARWVKECQLMVGYQGLLKLVRQSGELQTVQVQTVRERDDFDYEYGLNPFFRHKPAPGTPEERGPVKSYWAAATLKGGGSQFVVMTQAEIIAHRDKYSKGWEQQKANSTWGKEEEAMAQKTVLRKLCKLLPKSIERDHVSAALNLNDRAESGLTQRFSMDVPLALHSAVEDEAAETSTQSTAMPQRASEAAQGEKNPIEQQKANQRARLLALPDLDSLPDAMDFNVGDLVALKDKKGARSYWTPNANKSAWEEYKQAAEILAA